MAIALASATPTGCAAPTAAAPDAGPPPPDATPPSDRCAAPVEADGALSGQLTVDEGVAWTWTEDHYVYRQATVVFSEIVHDVVLPGHDQALVADPDTRRIHVYRTGAAPEMVPGITGVTWAGTARRGLLLDGLRVSLIGVDLVPSMIAELPIAPANYHGLDVGDEASPLAGLGDAEVVWRGADGTIRATALDDGVTRTLAPASTGALEIAAAGRFAAWRTSASVTLVDLTGALPARTIPVTAPDAAIALTGDALVVGAGPAVQVYAAADPQAPVQVLEVPRILPEDTVDTLAADRCGVFVQTAAGHMRTLAWP